MSTTRTRATTLIVALAVVLAGLAVTPAHAAARARTGPELLAEGIVLDLHNAARREPGAFGYGSSPAAPAITGWTDLRDVARSWSDRQAAEARMSHNPSFSSQICCWRKVGENVAFITLRSLDDAAVAQASRTIFQAWMDSSGHRANILSGDYDHVGVGISITPRDGGGYAMYLTGNFRDTTATPPGTSYTSTSSGASAQAAPEPEVYDTPACPDGEYARGTFDDSITGTHAGAIDCLVWWDVIRTSDGSGDVFGQGTVASRGFMAAIIARLAEAAGSPLPAPLTDTVRDDEGHRYEDAISRVVAAGIATGFPDGSFRPDATLTRGQMATFLANFTTGWLELTRPADADRFGDDDGTVHEDNIDLVAGMGIAYGTGTREFSPGRSLTRGQLASFAARTADVLVASGVPTP